MDDHQPVEAPAPAPSAAEPALEPPALEPRKEEVVKPASPKLALRSLLNRALPILSFVSGAIGALFMDRGPKRAAVVAAGTVATWFSLVALHALLRLELNQRESGRLSRYLLWAARFSGTALTQGMIQLGLFFSAPFYFHAAIVGVAEVDQWHTLFLAALLTLSAVTLWDPWTEWLLRQPLLAPLLPAVSSFVSLNCVLPGLGLSVRSSLWVAATATALGPAAMIAALAPKERRWSLAAFTLASGLALISALLFGAVRMIPAAPLRLVRADIGTQLDGKWVRDPGESFVRAPERLICATAIASPVGLKDRLFHVWRKDGRELWRIELEFTGGRKEGYRTRSTLRRFPTPARGRYECSVMTAAGQLLGTRAAVIEQ